MTDPVSLNVLITGGEICVSGFAFGVEIPGHRLSQRIVTKNTPGAIARTVEAALDAAAEGALNGFKRISQKAL